MVAKKAIQSLSFLWLGSVIGSGSTFIIYTILARQLGPSHFGIFSTALATISIFALSAGFGIPQVWLKLFGKEGWNGIRWVKPSLKFVSVTLIIISFAVLLLISIQQGEETFNQVLLLLLLYIYGNITVRLIAAKLQLEERYSRLTLWQLMPNLSRLIIIVLFYFVLNYYLSVIEVGWIYALVGICFLIIGLIELIGMMRGNLKLKGHGEYYSPELPTPKVADIFKEAWPFGFAGLFAFIYIQSDIIMVKYLTGDADAGYYNVSYTVIAAVMTLPTILFSKYLIPKYHRWSNHNFEKFRQTYRKGNKVMIFSGLGIMVAVLLLSKPVIELLFGIEYERSIILLNLLSLTIPFSFLAYSYGATLLTSEHMRIKVKLMGIVALFNVLVNLVLIPEIGAKGAAISTVVSNVLLAILYRAQAKKLVFNSK